MPTTNQEVSTRDTGKNHNSVAVLRSPVKFWWMIPMVVRRTTQTSSKKPNGGRGCKWQSLLSKFVKSKQK